LTVFRISCQYEYNTGFDKLPEGLLTLSGFLTAARDAVTSFIAYLKSPAYWMTGNAPTGAYEYQRAGVDADADGWERGVWWRRKYVRSYMPPLSLDNPSVISFLRHHRML
jgi:hypothetical protein